MSDLTLSPAVALLIFVMACFAGYRYRRVWAAEGPRWQLWLFGGVAAICLGLVAFLPIATNS
ncbi:hypothetical protein GG681_10365 [Epibacterium sp. SM1969]|uniref:Uncharacterized protein n=1 Tax=Tritonibacter aquimaris TaxID=2663379 RepID=A0A844AQA2_9RHOB|nr:hypothetical protein [Tritonibacter aquimaris]MQY43043.1 hypothetical protein [Tritonibacter aquimaris]